MESDAVDEGSLFAAIASSGARALLIGRRALVVLGLPVLTADYDFWLHADDVSVFNTALAPLGLFPNRTPEQARAAGRYVLENGEHVDVFIARDVRTIAGETASFDAIWSRRESANLQPGVQIVLPNLDDLMLTKRFAARPKDLEDLRLLETLRSAKLTK
jgi:hypothetical protein